MRTFTLYTARCVGDSKNCLFPNKAVITSESMLAAAVTADHVTATYKNNYRSGENFIQADVIPMDCDNDHSDKEEDWITPDKVAEAFPDVAFAVVHSRNSGKQKGVRSARPRFHVFFPTEPIQDAESYTQLKHRIHDYFPYFDGNALDAARLLFGTPNPKIEWFEGSQTILDFLTEEPDAFANMEGPVDEIGEGTRNNRLSHYAGRLLIRLGNTDEAYQLFLEEAAKCSPPLEEKELHTIWRSAQKFASKIASKKGYIPPEEYQGSCPLKPTDYTDVGQARVLAKEYGKSRLLYSPATDFLVYNGSFWEESKPLAQGLTQELTDRQLEEAKAEQKRWMAEMMKNGADKILADKGEKKAAELMSDEQLRIFLKYMSAVTYEKFALKMRDSKKITAAMKEVRPMVAINQSDLDRDEFLLNTPSGTYDLREGAHYQMEHRPEDLITKQTAVDPSMEGMDVWKDALITFFQGDSTLIEYVQRMVGLAAIGKVYVEALIIAHGEGRNGKSTFWNAISRVLGNYSGSISADILTVGCKRNAKPELAEARGKRMLIAAELEEGMRLNTSNVKQLCSTDEIEAEKKYKDPFRYIPTHTLVLYTNHLPKVGAVDKGTWRRLIVIPFNAVIEGKSDVKNYADYLVQHAGGAILTWVIEGAKKVFEDDFKVSPPAAVQQAIDDYKENNDWLGHYLSEHCELDPSYKQKSGELYQDYRNFCLQNGEYVRSTTDFYAALELEGFRKVKERGGKFVYGLKLVSEFGDFLQ